MAADNQNREAASTDNRHQEAPSVNNQDEGGASCDLVSSAAPPQTLLQVLAEARGLVYGMVESKDMCLQVLERFASIIAQVEASRPHTSLQAINRFSAILKDARDFLKKFSHKKAAFRLVYNRTVVNQNLKFHDDIDNLLRGLGFPEDDWKKSYELYRDAQQAAFEAMSRTRMALVGDLHDAQEQTEALSFLMFEYKQVNSKYTESQLEILNNAFNIVSQFSKNVAPTVDTWFLPPYEFECEETPFAWGAFGTVHHGKHCGSDVVIKRAKISSEADRAAYVKEVITWCSANKIPNVVRLFGAYHLGPDPYFVCEYAANGTLNDFLYKEENRHMTWKLLLDAALGLRGLHGLHIIHNDLKCNNILVATDGIAKLTDFGLSSHISAQKALSVLKAVGAVSWKAPEILAGTRAPSYESDIYAFAMCIYEAVSHKAPWAGVDDAMIRRNVKKGTLPKRPEGFTDDQWDLIEAMCALKPEDRLPMDEVVKRLETLYAAGSTSDPSTSILGGGIEVTVPAVEPSSEPANNAATSSTLPSIAEDPSSSLPSSSQADGSFLSEQLALEADQLEQVTMQEEAKQTETDVEAPARRLLGRHSSFAELDIHVLPGTLESTVPTPRALATDYILSAKIVRSRTHTEAGKEVGQYKVRVQLVSGLTFDVWKRYSNFRSVYKHLVHKFRDDVKGFPRFPRRKPSWITLSEVTKSQRRFELDAFLSAVIKSEKVPLEIELGNHQTAFKAGVQGSAAL